MVDTNLVAIGNLQEVSSGTVVMVRMTQVESMDFEVMARTNLVVSMVFEVTARMNLVVRLTLQGVNKGFVAMGQTNSVGDAQVVCCKHEGLRLGYLGLV